MQQRSARLGLHVYEVRLSAKEWVYYRADSVTITPAGALLIAVEVPPVEDASEDSTQIEYTPVAIFGPSQWQSCILVTEETHEPEFRQDVFERLYGGEDDET
jgi:hypothetical protein